MSVTLTSLTKKVLNQRLSPEEVVYLYKHAALTSLGSLAHARRMAAHPEPIVTYIIDRNINYTNICISGCKFCAYYSAANPDTQVNTRQKPFLLSREELSQKIQETLKLEGRQILLQGGLHPDLPLEYYENMLSFIKKEFPEIHCHAFSPPEIVHFARLSGLEIKTVLQRLISAGLDSIPGGGAEILVNRVRERIAPRKATAEDWLNVMETAHSLGLKTTATMMFGHIETIEERIEHLRVIRDLQDRTGGFTAFIPWPFQPQNTAIDVQPATADEYLRTLAISRLFLDNIANIQASWVTQGPKMAQISLFFGANDFGSTMIEENVVAAAGVSHRLSEGEIRRLIQNAGFEPRRRRMDYTLL